MSRDTEPQEMLIVLHICLPLMSYDSSDMSLCKIETIVSYKQERCIVTYF